MGRRRSVVLGKAGSTGQRSKRFRGRRAIATIAFLSVTILVAVVLLVRLHSENFADYEQFDINDYGDEIIHKVDAPPRRDFRLNPADHVFREPQTQAFHWRITSDDRRPDGVLKHVYLINNEFPGPTLETRSGDTLVIEVENALEQDEGITMHWHGLLMRGFNDMDGSAWITQSPIMPGETFTYNFTLDDSQHGTFWYHAHEATQRADGLYGGLIVHRPVPDPNAHHVDEEHLMLIGDWYHRPAKDALQEYSHPGAFGLETVPDSLLLNGAGSFNCPDAVPARPLDCAAEISQAHLSELHLNSHKQNIVRVINVGAYSGIKLTIHGSGLNPLSVDGWHSVSANLSKSVGYIHPGERVNFLVELGPVIAHYHSMLEISLDTANFKYENTALTPVHQFPVHWLGGLRKRSSPAWAFDEHLDIQTVKAAENQADRMPERADETIVLYAVTQKLSSLKNEPRGFMNQTTWHPQASPAEPLAKLSRDQWDDNQFVPRIQHDPDAPRWIDLVLNNLDEEGHPFHLHGYNFWVLSRYTSTLNWGSYNPYEDPEPPGGPYDLAGAVIRDTVYVPRRGYAVLRLRADNPGLWQFHCHVLWHLGSGMAMAFEVSG